MLNYFGQIPIIVRSSSFLEDGFGNAFAGKYESIFCVNACDPEERLLQFEDAVRRVYASTMDRSALEYRRQRGLDKMDEQMAIWCSVSAERNLTNIICHVLRELVFPIVYTAGVMNLVQMRDFCVWLQVWYKGGGQNGVDYPGW